MLHMQRCQAMKKALVWFVVTVITLCLCGCGDRNARPLSEPERQRINRELESDAHRGVEESTFMSPTDKRRIHGEVRETYDDWRRQDRANQRD